MTFSAVKTHYNCHLIFLKINDVLSNIIYIIADKKLYSAYTPLLAFHRFNCEHAKYSMVISFYHCLIGNKIMELQAT